MRERAGKLLGSLLLGWFCALAGCVYLGGGLASLLRGRRIEATDGILMGGLALVAGCAVLRQRRRRTAGRGEPDEKTPGRP
jgi:threonine/homoserine/homoserine lactone efflux protein